MFCVELRQPEQVFFGSRLCKIIKMLNFYADKTRREASAINGEANMKTGFRDAPTLTSLKDIPGFL